MFDSAFFRRCKLIFFVVCCLAVASLNANAAEDAGAKLHALFDEEWEWTLRENPTYASYLGDPRYNDRWTDVSIEAIERRHQHRIDTLKRLAEIDQTALSPADKLNYELFRKQYATDIEGHQYQWHLVPLTQRGGIQDANDLSDAIRFETLKDFEDWLARLRALPVHVDQTIALMRAGVAAGLVQPKVVMRRVPGQVKQQLVDDPAASLYFKPFRNIPESISAADRERLVAEAKKIIAEQVVPAYRTFDKFFNEEYFPACFDEVGAWQVPRGAEFYAFRARMFTTTSLTPEQIHELGQQEVRRIRGEMQKIMEQVGFKGTLQQFFEHLRTSPEYFYKNPDDLMAAYKEVSKRIDPQLPKLFGKLPRVTYDVQAIPMHIAPDTTTAYYREPSADGRRPGTYFVNLYKPEERPKWEMEALSLHEAVPGHHLQIALAMELGELPPFRRYEGYTAFVEGWGLYAESLGTEIGMYQDPYAKFGQLTYEMWRAVRLVVDTGMHAFRWKRQEAIDFFANNTPKTLLDIENEIDRYISWPGQALAYKIGELKFKELRARAQVQLGANFDVREFHDVVLSQGAVPLDVLEANVNEWLAAKKSGGPK